MGLLGLGVWGQRLLEKLLASSEFEVLVAVDPRPPRKDFPVPVRVRVEELWQFPLDAVAVATSPDLQGFLGLEVLKRGLSLFIEKPMALSEGIADSIVRAASRNRLIVHVDHLVRYDSLHAFALENIHDGELGELVGSLHVRLGARSRPGIAPHSVLLPHDLSLVHAASGAEGEWEAMLTQTGCLLAQRRRPSGERAQLLIGATGPSCRQTLYAGSQRTILVEEGERLRVFPALGSERLRELQRPLEASALQRMFADLTSEVALVERRASGDALAASLAAFSRAVQTGEPTVCDAMEGARVTRALVAIERALERERN